MSESQDKERCEQSAVESSEQVAQEEASVSGQTQVDEPSEIEPQLAEEVTIDFDALQSELESLAEANNILKEEAIRAKADAQNVRRRADRDVENAHKFALEKFVKELIPMFDSLEMGLEKIPEDDEAQRGAREGLSLTLKQGLEALKKANVEQIAPVGQPFDPALHQAMAMQPDPEAEPNTVLHVMQKGYMLSGRLMRPAMVVVSQAVVQQRVDESV